MHARAPSQSYSPEPAETESATSSPGDGQTQSGSRPVETPTGALQAGGNNSNIGGTYKLLSLFLKIL